MTKIIAFAVLLAAVPLQASQPPKATRTMKQPAGNAAKSDSESGDQVFHRNCSRCHKAPEGLPPSVSGTVALHMRIRAGLSEQEYRKLLAFLNP